MVVRLLSPSVLAAAVIVLCTSCSADLGAGHGEHIELRSGVYSGREGTTVALSEAEEHEVLIPLTALLASGACMPIPDHEIVLGGIYLSRLPEAITLPSGPSATPSELYVVNGKVIVDVEGSASCAISENTGELISVLRSIAQNRLTADELAILTLEG